MNRLWALGWRHSSSQAAADASRGLCRWKNPPPRVAENQDVEIRWANAMGKRWLHPGYATEQPSAYDYKKSFRPLQHFDWSGNWLPLEKESA